MIPTVKIKNQKDLEKMAFAKDYTLAQWARAAGIQTATLARCMKTGKAAQNTAQKLARVLGVSMLDLCEV